MLFGGKRTKRFREESNFAERVLRNPKLLNKQKFWQIFANIGAFVLFGIILVFIAFWGRPPHAPTIYRGYEPNYTFTATKDFEYKSIIQRRERQKEARVRTPIAYKVEMAKADSLLALQSEIKQKNAEHFDELKKLYVRSARVDAIIETLKNSGAQDVPELHGLLGNLAMEHSQLIQHCNTAKSYRLMLETAERVYRNLAEFGIYDDEVFGNARHSSQFRIISKRAFDAETFRQVFAKNLNPALWRNVFEDETSSNISKVAQTLVELFSTMGLLQANMSADEEETTRLQELAAESVPEVIEKVRAGEPLLLKGVRVTDAMLERWNAYCEDTGEHFWLIGDSAEVPVFIFNSIYAFCVLCVGVLFCYLVVPQLLKKNRRRILWLAATLILINIAVIRGLLEAFDAKSMDFVLHNHESIQAWLAAPVVIAILVTSMVGAPFAIAVAMFVSAIVTIMVGGSTGFFLTSSVAVLIAVRISSGATKRSTFIRAGVYAGIAVALTALPVNMHAGTPLAYLAYGLGISIVIGFFSGIISAGMLSIFEGIFKLTTNITLLELADYNHPLLRRLQVVAPGTFHHCVMVSDYAAKAAGAIGANMALCRCAALYHDIGKMMKPEYFTENQKVEIGNPHDAITPSMSALIIKSHVREGTELATEYHLPEPVREIMEQHHGTSMTGYFIRKARELATLAGENGIIDESNYRYDGPKPQSVEAAVVMLCDVVEAASRSIRRVTPQSIRDLVYKLVMDRVEEGEFDECPITIDQIYIVRESLIASVLTTFHSRVEYPKDEKKPKV